MSKNVKLSNGKVLQRGDYARDSDGTLYALTPTGLLANLDKHSLTEHEDGTITVSPSILVEQGSKRWHGFLEKGVWRQVA